MDRARQQGLYSLTGHDRLRVSERFIPVTDFFLLGKVLKAHGTAGQVRLLVEDKFKSYLKPGFFLFFDIDGSKIPYRIEAVDDDAHFTITLNDIAGREQADAFGGKECWVPVEHIKKHHLKSPAHLPDKWSEYTIHDEVSDQLFAILRTEELPQQLMAIIAIEGVERYIPLHEQLITSIDKEAKIIHMQFPDGLLGI
jgi:ribosomal 30S subunit maturation factor RimM